MFPPSTDDAVLADQRRIGQRRARACRSCSSSASGAGKPWQYVGGQPYNRRITADTPFTLTGPAAGSPLLQTAADPTGRTVLGTFGNCSGGTTPWGTILSGEENFNGYFRATGTDPTDKRYGLADKATHLRLGDHRRPVRRPRPPAIENEANRFGWIVEVDPFEPDAPPVKHTAMGGFKHEGANVIVGRGGHVVAYMGDDERFDYLYKFVSATRPRRWQCAGEPRPYRTATASSTRRC